ncbi:MAG TPA: 50S ribosomal protein L5 [bacterium]|nr:50S ribosomal protein L5 [bacterium]HPN80997.1 50S ribosomal protein L5 [bacterium]HPW39280.1 50S ribosomal protein L5 [bacterium]HQA64060.1 50S ribosomal protein L5 [bacterium]
MESRLYKKYLQEVRPALKEKFSLANDLAVPRIDKVSLNVGINSRNTDSGYLEKVEEDLTKITGQKPVRTKAKKAISAFKVREGMVVGVKVTLRGQRMYDFLDKLINVTIPRIRDFRGLPEKNVDQRGNLNLGFKEHNVFPEIKADDIEKIHGLEIAISTTADDYASGLELFKLLGFPFQKNNK